MEQIEVKNIEGNVIASAVRDGTGVSISLGVGAQMSTVLTFGEALDLIAAIRHALGLKA